MLTMKNTIDDMFFLHEDVFNFNEFWGAIGRPGAIDSEVYKSILNEAARFSETCLKPINLASDLEGCQFVEGQVKTPSVFKKAWKDWQDGGWSSLRGLAAYGGLSLPHSLSVAVDEIHSSACMAFMLGPIATAEGARLLERFASADIKARYLPRLYKCDWSVSMDITEAQAGSDLSLIQSTAVPVAGDYYLLSGNKIFITWGDHDLSDNIVHLVLARTPSAPAGNKGLSLFLVPKVCLNDKGELADRNEIYCTGIENKMGLHAAPTCSLHFSKAKAWLIGEENAGLQCMFSMMNAMRLSVACNAVGVASRASQQAMDYARDRRQGKSRADENSTTRTIIQHADIRRMLLSNKAWYEGGRALNFLIAMLLDEHEYSDNSEDKENADALSSWLTPICKAFTSDRAIECSLEAQQVLGGHGYIRESGLEQHVRDLRVTQIFEGTNGIQALDLLRRKTIAQDARGLKLLGKKIECVIESLPTHYFEEEAQALKRLLTKILSLSVSLCEHPDSRANDGIAVDYLQACGYLVYAWLWLKIAVTCKDKNQQFYQSKRTTAHFYFSYLLPQAETHLLRIHQSRNIQALLDEAL